MRIDNWLLIITAANENIANLLVYNLNDPVTLSRYVQFLRNEQIRIDFMNDPQDGTYAVLSKLVPKLVEPAKEEETTVTEDTEFVNKTE